MAATEAEIFKDEKTHPIVLLKSYLAMFGPEALEWGPAVIKRSVEDRTQSNISRAAFFKLMSAIAVANHDRFWDSWQTFHTICQGLNGDGELGDGTNESRFTPGTVLAPL